MNKYIVLLQKAFFISFVFVFFTNCSSDIVPADPERNYTKKYTLRDRVTTDSEIDDAEKLEDVFYIDGLGRSIQHQQMGRSPDNNTIVTEIEYDALGRTPKTYLPYARTAGHGNYVDDPITQLSGFYSGTDGIADAGGFPFSEREFESSPLNRVFKETRPGVDWNISTTHVTSLVYITNTESDQVHKLVPCADGSICRNGFYEERSLHKTITTDEDGNQMELYVDFRERIILERKYVDFEGFTTLSDTYSIYDEHENVMAVLPPEASKLLPISGVSTSYDVFVDPWNLIDDTFNDLIYTYLYDERQRLIEKKIPNKGTEVFMYDILNRPVLSQDANLAENDEWLFTKYDRLNRPIMTGIVTFYMRLRSEIQIDIDNSELYDSENTDAATHFYTDNAFPQISMYPTTVLTVSYYDDYDFDNNGANDFSFIPNLLDFPTAEFPTRSSLSAFKGQKTGMKVRVLDHDPNTMTEWLQTAVFYDKFGQIILEIKNNYLVDAAGVAAVDILEYGYNHAGEIIKEKILHTYSNSSTSLPVVKTHEYDHGGRLLRTKMNFNSPDEIILCEKVYNEIGQLQTEKLHSEDDGANFLQHVDYSYNIQGAITKINDIDADCTPDNPKGGGSSSRLSSCFADQTISREDLQELSHNYFPTSLEREEAILPILEYLEENNLTSVTSEEGLKAIDVLSVLNFLSKKPKRRDRTFFSDRGQHRYNSHRSNLIELKNNDLYKEKYAQYKNYLISYLEHLCIESTSETSSYAQRLTDATGGPADLFAMDLHYQEGVTGTDPGATGYHNGNISGMFWRTTDCIDHGYTYRYDQQNRLTNAFYFNRTAPAAFNDDYSVKDIEYDLNGNLQTLLRKNGGEERDVLTYTYSGNQLLAVDDATTSSTDFGFVDQGQVYASSGEIEYLYDNNGNLTEDKNKDIDIAYNFLNLPTQITFPNNKVISWTYDALGNKLEKRVESQITFAFAPSNSVNYKKQYIHGFEYKKFGSLSGTNSPEAYYHSKGRVRILTGGDAQFEYGIKDHLGNARICFTDANFNGIPEVLEETHYYPFGLRFIANLGSDALANNYQYNGKELNDDFGLNWIDYGARWYDPQLGRWGSVDPLVEQFVAWSPYNYVYDNPIKYIDPDGRGPTDYLNENNEVIFRSNDNLDGGVTVIPNQNVEIFFENFDIYRSRGTEHSDGANKNLRQLGTTYDKASFLKFAKNGENNFDKTGTSFYESTMTPARVESSAGLISSDAGKTIKADNTNVAMGGSTSSIVLVGSQYGSLHHHPDNNRAVGLYHYTKKGSLIEIEATTSLTNLGPSPRDKRRVVYNSSYHIVTGLNEEGKQTIYLHNKEKGETVISAPLE